MRAVSAEPLNPAARRLAPLAVIAVGLVVVLSAWAPWRSRTYLGAVQAIGGGTVQAYVTFRADGAPAAVGVRLSAGALEQLPRAKNTHSRCFDLDADGTHTGHECIGDEERVFELPAGLWRDGRIPFKWITVNWNPEGHPAPYARPHFDFHFFAWDRERVEAIRPGRCGELVDCDAFERASRPLPPRYLPSGHIDVGAVVPRMGNHLLDSRSPEMADSLTPFTRTFIYGAFEGELIFWEPMITRDLLRRATDECFEIRQPQAFRRTGYYPTRYCMRREAQSGARTVSLEGFVYAEGS
jgi:hypothetical protein